VNISQNKKLLLCERVNIKIEKAGFTTKAFNSNDEIDDYTSQEDYESLSVTKETLCFAVVINKNNVDNQYEYMLRFNVSNYGGGDLPNTGNSRVETLAL